MRLFWNTASATVGESKRTTAATEELLVLKRRVSRGAAALDREKRFWQYGVIPSALLMYSPEWCLLSQLYGSYKTGLDTLKLTPEAAVEHGFTLPKSDRIFYPHLEELWKEQIERRRRIAKAA